MAEWLEGRGRSAARPGAAAAALAVVVSLLAAAPAAGAQSLSEQVALLGEHAEQLAGSASNNTTGAVANATDPEWQAFEANWTRAWSCSSVGVVNEDARRALEDAGACPALPDAAAGEEEEEDAGDAAVADAVPLANDSAVAVADELAAAEDLINGTLSDPTNVTGHLERVKEFLDRTLDVIQRIIGGVPDALAGAFNAVADALVGIGKTVGGAIGDALVGVAETFRDAGEAIVGLARDVLGGIGAGASAGAGGLKDAVTGIAGGVGTGATETGEAIADAAGAVVEVVKDIVGGAAGPLGGGDDGPARGRVKAPVDAGGLLDLELPL